MVLLEGGLEDRSQDLEALSRLPSYSLSRPDCGVGGASQGPIQVVVQQGQNSCRPSAKHPDAGHQRRAAPWAVETWDMLDLLGMALRPHPVNDMLALVGTSAAVGQSLDLVAPC